MTNNNLLKTTDQLYLPCHGFFPSKKECHSLFIYDSIRIFIKILNFLKIKVYHNLELWNSKLVVVADRQLVNAMSLKNLNKYLNTSGFKTFALGTTLYVSSNYGYYFNVNNVAFFLCVIKLVKNIPSSLKLLDESYLEHFNVEKDFLQCCVDRTKKIININRKNSEFSDSQIFWNVYNYNNSLTTIDILKKINIDNVGTINIHDARFLHYCCAIRYYYNSICINVYIYTNKNMVYQQHLNYVDNVFFINGSIQKLLNMCMYINRPNISKMQIKMAVPLKINNVTACKTFESLFVDEFNIKNIQRAITNAKHNKIYKQNKIMKRYRDILLISKMKLLDIIFRYILKI